MILHSQAYIMFLIFILLHLNGNDSFSLKRIQNFSRRWDQHRSSSQMENNTGNFVSLINHGKNIFSKRYASPVFARRGPADNFILQRRVNYSKHITASNVILAINAAVFILSAVLLPNLNLRFMKINYKIARGEIYRLVTPLFLHGSISHILMNSFSLKELGPQVIDE